MHHVAIGIVGAGDAGRRHALAALNTPAASIKYVSDLDTAAADRLVAELNLKGVEVVELHACPPVDLVCICTPPDSHTRYAIDALLRDESVLIEKPISPNVSDIDLLQSTAGRSRGADYAVCQHRYAQASLAIKALLESGSRVMSGSVHVRRRRSADYYAKGWKGNPDIAGGGVLISLAFHALDLLCWWLGEPVETTLLLDSTNRVERAASGVIRFEGGTLVSVEVSAQETATYPDRIDLVTGEARVVWEGDSTVLDGRHFPREADLHSKQLSTIVNNPESAYRVSHVAATHRLIAAMYLSAQRRAATHV